MDPPIDPLRAFRLLAHSDLAAPAPELSRPIGAGPQVGDVLEGRFRLDELLARGGMGQVFRAQDTALERPVAIKTLLLPGGEARLRFSREAELTARLRHAHVLQVHGSGEAAGSCYIVYELIEGARTLEDALAVLDLDGRLDLLEQVAEGVGAAHALGIVHRDLKPQNVLVRPGGSALVADFGVAHMETSSLTVSGQMLGTPAYMAPEQVNGESITPATDVWSLGIMLYEALYGRHPFADALGLPALMQRIQDVELDCPAGPPRPLVRLLRRRLLVAAPAERVADGDAFL
ncbi:MAG: serine/threonine protein kinase, partial [Planctomycetes bacterium]|nr:serine/threonine protein kinase [Planctomycetota bacterium]